MGDTTIEWADKVWNPVTGCTKVSQGCKNCYAERIAGRFWGERKFTDVICHEDRLEIPLHWRKPAKIFVNSMSDLFHPAVPPAFISKVFSIMDEKRKMYDGSIFIILTKRPYNMQQFIGHWYGGEHQNEHFRLSNVWLGVSVEDQKTAQERIPFLYGLPAVRFVSVEPMLERIDLGLSTAYIDWVVCGGESGPKARPQPPYIDFRHLKDQCVKAGIPFFLKQMYGKKMPELDGQIWNQYPVTK